MTQALPKSRAHTRYRLADGTQVPGVTTIVGQLDKPALVKWANQLGLQGIDATRYRDAAADVGTCAHRLIQAHWQGEDYQTVRQALAEEYGEQTLSLAENAALSYFEWEKEHEVQAEFCERPMVSEKHRYGGTCDFYGLVDGKRALLDLKTGSAIYPEHVIQVAAYRQMLREHGFAVERVVILNIPRKESEDFDAKWPSRANLDAAWRLFRHLRAVYELRREIA
ncbi:MAG TPA: hypothetical protein VF171_07165 [Trueperaceae bacterium]